MPSTRSNNASGYPGVHQKRNKWEARITYQNVTYHLSVFEKCEDALNAWKEAEEQLRKDSGKFPQWVLHKRKEETKK